MKHGHGGGHGGCHGEGHRMFLTKAEKLEHVIMYKEMLEKELKGVEEAIAELQK